MNVPWCGAWCKGKYAASVKEIMPRSVREHPVDNMSAEA